MENATIKSTGQSISPFTSKERFELGFVADAAAEDGGALFTDKISPACKAFRDMAIQVYIDLSESAVAYADALRVFKQRLAAGPVPDDAADVAMMIGFSLNATSSAWKAFCQRLDVPSGILWTFLPAYGRMQEALTLSGQQFGQMDVAASEAELNVLCQQHGWPPRINAQRLGELYAGQYLRQLERHAAAVV